MRAIFHHDPNPSPDPSNIDPDPQHCTWHLIIQNLMPYQFYSILRNFVKSVIRKSAIWQIQKFWVLRIFKIDVCNLYFFTPRTVILLMIIMYEYLELSLWFWNCRFLYNVATIIYTLVYRYHNLLSYLELLLWTFFMLDWSENMYDRFHFVICAKERSFKRNFKAKRPESFAFSRCKLYVEKIIFKLPVLFGYKDWFSFYNLSLAYKEIIVTFYVPTCNRYVNSFSKIVIKLQSARSFILKYMRPKRASEGCMI